MRENPKNAEDKNIRTKFLFFRLRLRELVNSEWTGLILGCKRYVNSRKSEYPLCKAKVESVKHHVKLIVDFYLWNLRTFKFLNGND